MTGIRRFAAIALSMALLAAGAGIAEAAEPTVAISGTVVGHSTSPERTSPLPGTLNFAVALTDCADEERRVPPNNDVGVLMPVAADGTYEDFLVASCAYDVQGVSVVCGGLEFSPPVELAAGIGGEHDFVIDFGAPDPLEAEPTLDVSPGYTLDLVDTSRTVDLWPCSFNSSRSVPTTVIMPAGTGPHPLVIVGHGLGGRRDSMQPRGVQLAQAGYIVVIPSFASRQSPQAVRDLANQPGDVSFVLKEILRRNANPLDDLYGRVDPQRMGMSGVSGGAITALLLFNTCCRDPRIKAIHAELGFFLGAPLVTTPLSFKHRIPLLMANNRNDQLIPWANAEAGWNDARADKYLVSVDTACDALSHCLGPVGAIRLVEFFDAYLKGDTAAKELLKTTFSQPSEDGVQWRLDLGGKNR